MNPAELQSKSVIYGARNARFYDSTQNFATGLQLKYEPLFNVTVGTSFLYSTLGNSKVYGVDLSGANYRIAEAFAIYTNGHFETRVVGVYSSVAESEKINEVFKNKIGSAQFGTLLEVSHEVYFEEALNEAMNTAGMNGMRDTQPSIVETDQKVILEDELIEQADTQLRFQAVAKALRHHYSLVRNGITGSNR